MTDRHKNQGPDHGKLHKELEALDVRREEILKELAEKAFVPFPRMVYQDIDGNGDISEPSNQKQVKNQDELDHALKNGWVVDPSELKLAPKPRHEETAKERDQAVVDGKGNFGKGPGPAGHVSKRGVAAHEDLAEQERKTGGKRF